MADESKRAVFFEFYKMIEVDVHITIVERLWNGYRKYGEKQGRGIMRIDGRCRMRKIRSWWYCAVKNVQRAAWKAGTHKNAGRPL